MKQNENVLSRYVCLSVRPTPNHIINMIHVIWSLLAKLSMNNMPLEAITSLSVILPW